MVYLSERRNITKSKLFEYVKENRKGSQIDDIFQKQVFSASFSVNTKKINIDLYENGFPWTFEVCHNGVYARIIISAQVKNLRENIVITQS